jgi:hypothetical protein
MKVLNQVQLVAILIFVALGSFIFLSPYLSKKTGAIVVDVSNPDCQNIHAGDVITEAGGNQVQSMQDFNSLKFQQNQFVSIVVNSGPGGCKALSDGTLGINAKSTSSQGMLLGVDLIGGRKYVINAIPVDKIQNTTAVLNARIQYFGISGIKIEKSGAEIDITAPDSTNVKQILFPGYFEGSVEEQVALGSSTLVYVGDTNYTVVQNGGKFLIGGDMHSVGESFYLKDVKATIENATNDSVILSFQIYNNSDILGEVPGYAQFGFDQSSGFYSFSIVISLKPTAAKKFGEVTQNIKTVISGNQVNLNAMLVDKLDGIGISRLGIPVTLKNQNLNNVAIVAYDSNKGVLTNKKILIEAAVNSGYISYNLSIARTEEIQSTQKNNVIPSLVAIVALLVAAPLVMGRKYKKMKHNSISILIGAAEIFSVVSLFAAFQLFYKLNIMFDFAALVGIMLLSLNWMFEVVAINLSRHAQKELTVRVRYKKIISVTGMLKVALFIGTIGLAAYGYGNLGIIIFSGLILDFILFRPFYKSFVS